MALEAPLRSSAANPLSPFSPLTDMSMSSPDSPAAHAQFRPVSSGSVETGSLRPPSATANRPMSVPNTHIMSPSDIVGPSPVTSVGTEVTEIEDEISEEVGSQASAANPEPLAKLLMLKTNIPDNIRQNGSAETVSVIHAPESFHSWAGSESMSHASDASESSQNTSSRRSSPRSSPKSSPKPDDSGAYSNEAMTTKTKSPPPLTTTNIKPARYSLDSATPRAQNLQDLQKQLAESGRRRPESASSLELIPESREFDTDAEPDSESLYDTDYTALETNRQEEAIQRSKQALQNCWTVCNTFADLSTGHRDKVSSRSPDEDERAWKCCWRICQRLYENQDKTEKHSNVRLNLELCRDFCNALYDVRRRQTESEDSVLRMSFELNNHLYSAFILNHNHNVPDAFHERTLDFYITLCHRLMRQRGEIAYEAESLLDGCWALAVTLLDLRKNRLEGGIADEELFTLAVDACFALCNNFKEIWAQARPERSTPRPSQSSLSYYSRDSDQDGRASRTSTRSKGESLKSQKREKARKAPPVPETPVTEFEDTPVSPDTDSPQVPNILVLGTDSNKGGRWSSNASNLSSYSQSSQRTSSSATTTASSAEDVNVTRIKTLVLKAAMNIGFPREQQDAKGGSVSLQSFVKALPAGSFGSLSSHASLLQNYKNLVVADSSFRHASLLPTQGKRVLAIDVAKSVAWMMQRSSQYGFLRDLFKLVFGFHLEEVEARRNVSIAV